jgi:hypothetical protein
LTRGAKLLMVFLSNLGWKISVWSTSCYCSSAWWWWWLLLWDLLERCKEVPFFFSLCDLFGGGHLDSAGGFLLEKDIILSIGLLLLSVAGNDRAGFESTLDKNTRYGSRIVCYWSLHPLHGREVFLLAVDLWSS